MLVVWVGGLDVVRLWPSVRQVWWLVVIMWLRSGWFAVVCCIGWGIVMVGWLRDAVCFGCV